MGLPSTGSLEFGAPMGWAVLWGPFLVVTEAQVFWRQEGGFKTGDSSWDRACGRCASEWWTDRWMEDGQADRQAMGGNGP